MQLVKTLIVLIQFLSLPLAGYCQIELVWTDELVVNDNAKLGYARPDIVLDRDGTPIVMWSRRGNLEVYTAKLIGNKFTDPYKLNPTALDFFTQDWAGPEMKSHGNYIYAIMESEPGTTGLVYLIRSEDGGISFSDTIRVSDDFLSRFPTIDISPEGKIYVAYMKFEPGFKEPHYVITYSTDNGQTFSKPVKATGDAKGESCDCCPAHIVAHSNGATLLFRNNDQNLRDIWASTSIDGGNNFTISKDIDFTNWNINGCPSTSPSAISEEDSLIFTWMSGSSGDSRIAIGTAKNANLSIGLNQYLTPKHPSNAVQNHPRISGKWKTMGVVWQESLGSGRFIRFIAGKNGVNSLLGAKIHTVNSDTLGISLNPQLAYHNGTFHFTWQDSRTRKIYYRAAKVKGHNTSYKTPTKTITKIYPNPSNGYLTIETNRPHYNAKIFNTQGELIASFYSSSSRFSIKTDNWGKGIYFLHFEGDNKNLTNKIIVD